MKMPAWLRYILTLIALILLAEIVILVIVGLVGWRAGWNTAEQYGEGLQIAGLLAIGFGFFGIKGNWDATRSFGYQYSMSATSMSSWQRTQQTLFDFAQAFQFLILMFIVGGLNLFLGWFI